MPRPSFLITIDTEGDNLWDYQTEITTKNAQYLERFQTLCERFAYKPCYLTNYEMAIDPHFQRLAEQALKSDSCEIGMHLHAWNSPPVAPISDDDNRYKPFLIEYPVSAMREKIAFQTKLLRETFDTPIVTHRAGRWAFNSNYAKLLVEFGYRVDCSVTPHVDWTPTRGAPSGKGGTDFSRFPEKAYFVDLDSIERAGQSALLEIPMTIATKYAPWIQTTKSALEKLRGKQKPPSTRWLRPRRGNVEEMIRLAHQRLENGHDYLQFMLHSSEFMPGANPTFKTESDIEDLYRDLEKLFRSISQACTGRTLAEYRDSFCTDQ